ncbi:metallophosphoesterase family protein [Pseudopelagicola sp. nBUS_19]|uniref:metallophosphoesterase family protein n=1 Tax=unclassified Pseudopelagicola TaxID=2649563 RepID=UPI003EB862C0
MKILAFSDMHHSHRAARDIVAASFEADLVIGVGDFCNQRCGLSEAFGLLDSIQSPMIVVPGNNESEKELREVVPKNVTVLHGQSMEIAGLRVFGLGYAVPVTPFTDWSCDLTEEVAEDMLSKFGDSDLLITHSPPKGFVDLSSSGMSLGSVSVLNAIKRETPGLVMCGHIHDCWGESAKVGQSRIVNLGPTTNWFEFRNGVWK